MKSADCARGGIDQSWWARPELSTALANRNVPAVYEFLQVKGFSQTRIAALTGQSQPEVSAILAHGRQVAAYEVLVRIADGLGIPRGLMGLAHTTAGDQTDGDTTTVDSQARRRDHLGLLAKITMGASLGAAELVTLAGPATTAPVPRQLDAGHVHRVEALTLALQAQHRAVGGEPCREAVVGGLNWATGLRRCTMTDTVRRALDRALADLEQLAGWASHDLRLSGAAEHYYVRSVYSAKLADEPVLLVNALNRLGWLYFRDGHRGDAARVYRLAALAASGPI